LDGQCEKEATQEDRQAQASQEAQEAALAKEK
jgi:hypothetical protein